MHDAPQEMWWLVGVAQLTAKDGQVVAAVRASLEASHSDTLDFGFELKSGALGTIAPWWF